MKRQTLVALFFLSILFWLTACGPEQTAPETDVPAGDPTTTTATSLNAFASERSGIALTVPNGWWTDESTGTLILSSHEEAWQGEPPAEAYAYVAVQTAGLAMANLTEAASSQELVTFLEAQVSQYVGGGAALSQATSPVAIGDKNGATATLQILDGSGRLTNNIFTIFTDNEKLVTVIAVTPADDMATFQPLFTAINESIVINDVNLALVEGVVLYENLSRDHDSNILYEPSGLPPAGGTHDPVWQNCGVYDQEVEIKHALHSLEHGAVWITYQPELPADEIQKLAQYATNQSYILVSPYPGLQSPIVLTAWGVQLELETAFDERITEFIAAYQNGPQTPEPGATCAGGTG